MEEIEKQLQKMNINYSRLTEIQSKGGVFVYRFSSDGFSYIAKYFANEPDRREIMNYSILTDLNIPTLRVIEKTDCCLILEDVGQSKLIRLGVENDLGDIEVAKSLAQWYKLLHERGSRFISSTTDRLYDETDVITKENIEFIIRRTKLDGCPVWNLVFSNLDRIVKIINSTHKTLTYNDFFFSNLVVRQDKSSAFMFDYHLLGIGYVYSDLRNVCYSLSPSAKSAFLEEYGNFDNFEIAVDDVASVLITLYFACERKSFPQWANEYLALIYNGFSNRVLRLINDGI